MTSREITSVAIKAFAIYILLQAILSVPFLSSALVRYGFFEKSEPSAVLLWALGFASFAVVVILAVLIWKLANRIVDQSNTSAETKNTSNITEGFLISLLGLYLVIEGLIQFGYASVTGFSTLQEGVEVSIQQISYVVGNLAQIAIGLSLVLKAKGWVSFLNWLRGAGLEG